MTITIFEGDCRDVLRTLEEASVQTCVTSPPYWGLRDYGIPPSVWGGSPVCEHNFSEERVDRSRRSPGTQNGSLTGDGRYQATACRFEIKSSFCACGAWRGAFGLEPTYQLYVDHAVEIFREVRRVLRDDGTLWLNLGDSYATGAGAVGNCPGGGEQGERWLNAPGGRGHRGRHLARQSGKQAPRIEAMGPVTQPNRMPQHGLKPKDLCGIPWRVAFALQADGWWLRQDIIWSKPNPMPESVTDRCTKAHEYLFLLTKSERYCFDQDTILEPIAENTHLRVSQATLDEQVGSDRVPGKTNDRMKAVAPGRRSGNKSRKASSERGCPEETGKNQPGSIPWEGYQRNRRSVWTITTQPFSEAHFATFPPALIEPCVLAGCPKGGMVIDPFLGAGTTALVADRLGRNCIGIELNPDYAAMAKRRLEADAGMFSQTEIVRPLAEAAE